MFGSERVRRLLRARVRTHGPTFSKGRRLVPSGAGARASDKKPALALTLRSKKLAALRKQAAKYQASIVRLLEPLMPIRGCVRGGW